MIQPEFLDIEDVLEIHTLQPGEFGGLEGARDHAFMDGNKRTALLSTLVFLDVNGVAIDHEDDRLYEGQAHHCRAAQNDRPG